MSHLVHVVLYLLDKSCLLKVFHDSFAAGKAIHTDVFATIIIESTVVVEDVDALQPIFHTEVIVVDVVGGGDLQCTGTKLAVYVFVHDDRHHTSYAGPRGARIRRCRP